MLCLFQYFSWSLVISFVDLSLLVDSFYENFILTTENHFGFTSFQVFHYFVYAYINRLHKQTFNQNGKLTK